MPMMRPLGRYTKKLANIPDEIVMPSMPDPERRTDSSLSSDRSPSRSTNAVQPSCQLTFAQDVPFSLAQTLHLLWRTPSRQ